MMRVFRKSELSDTLNYILLFEVLLTLVDGPKYIREVAAAMTNRRGLVLIADLLKNARRRNLVLRVNDPKHPKWDLTDLGLTLLESHLDCPNLCEIHLHQRIALIEKAKADLRNIYALNHLVRVCVLERLLAAPEGLTERELSDLIPASLRPGKLLDELRALFAYRMIEVRDAVHARGKLSYAITGAGKGSLSLLISMRARTGAASDRRCL
jgi:DNA-binding HxlR family transcriptional regulator